MMKAALIFLIAVIALVSAQTPVPSNADTEINLVFDGMIPASGCTGCTGSSSGRSDSLPESQTERLEGDYTEDADCSFLNYDNFRNELSKAVCGKNWPCSADGVPGENGDNGGLGMNVWGTVVNRAGRVCAVAYTGPTNTDQWPASRVLSMQKAETANAMSVNILSLSTANLYQATQPGGTLYGIESSNPVSTANAYGGLSANYGNACGTTSQDPACGKKIGGITAVGGGLTIFIDGNVIGGVGISGDTSCADHNIAWKVRDALMWDDVTEGAGSYFDNIIYPAQGASSLPAFGHPLCSARSMEVASEFHVSHPVGGNVRPAIAKRSVDTDVAEAEPERENKFTFMKPKIPQIGSVNVGQVRAANVPKNIVSKMAVMKKSLQQQLRKK